MVPLLIALAALAGWLYLWLAPGRFWKIDRQPVPSAPREWPGIVAVIPARNEAAVIEETLRSLWAQDYPGPLRIVLVDDHSDDGTGAAARAVAEKLGRGDDLTVLPADDLPPGWTGKVWAMHQGVTRGIPAEDPGRYVLFSDADIEHGETALRELVCRAEAGPCDLVSFMVRLRCESLPERLLIPAFVHYFRMLYPFRRVNDPADPLGGAAGGTMLVRREALRRIGGMARIRSAVIDDCSLGAAVKEGGHRVWLGLGETSASTRGYGSVAEILRMISRTAYTQLGYSPVQLAGCLAGLALTFLAPPVLALSAGWPAALPAAAAWGLMAALYLPMVRFYRQSPLWAPLLPLTALLYMWATLVSAWNHHRGRGGQWKGRSASSAVNASPAEGRVSR